MHSNPKTILLVGFNTRPLAHSLHSAGFKVHSVDFFGDLDLFPKVEDSIIVLEKLQAAYGSIKNYYSDFLVEFAIDMLEKHPNVNYLLIGSGLDDNHDGRMRLQEYIRDNNLHINDLNNTTEVIKQSRDVIALYDFLKKEGEKCPQTFVKTTFEDMKRILEEEVLRFPFILKKSKSSGGINVIKISNMAELELNLKTLEVTENTPQDWILQEFIDGKAVSCTMISNGRQTEIISVNRQIIGEKFLNSPGEFMYCGNIVPSNLLKSEEEAIKKITLLIASTLNLKGINGFDYVLKNGIPYLMEINPRIPGSIRASECALNINLLDLHVKSFNNGDWKDVQSSLKGRKPQGFATKLIYFAPQEISVEKIKLINELEHVHDKSVPKKPIQKNEPVCTVLYEGGDFSESYFGALKVIDGIKTILFRKKKE